MPEKFNSFDNANNLDIYRELYENSLILFRTINVKGEIINCNKAYSTATGYSKEEIIGQNIFAHTAIESLDEMTEMFNTWKSGKSYSNKEMWLRKRNGEKFLGLFSANNLYDNGVLVGSNTAIQDITEITQLKKEFKNLKRKRQEIMGELSVRIAHDLKNPLSVIKNSVEILKIKNPCLTQQNLNLFQAINRSVLRMDHQITQVFEFVNPASLNLDEHSMQNIFESVLSDMIDSENVIIQLPKNDCMVSCDRIKMENVFANLILNAIQAMNGTGTVVITLDENDSHAKIRVKDSGPGIPDELTSKIFDPLFTTRQIGTGLGLPSCKSIIEQHGGDILFDTAVGKGTAFEITLPKSELSLTTNNTNSGSNSSKN
ncbi:MAG: two-component system sensor histidine kinase NtrB [Candidatus Nitrosopumilus sp. bin_68KS]